MEIDGKWALLLLLLSRFSRVRLCATPIDGSPPGSPVPGILQARTMEWAAISFSNAWKWKVKVKSLSHVWLLVTPWMAAHQAPPPMGSSRQEYWSGVPLPFPKMSTREHYLGDGVVLYTIRAVVVTEHCMFFKIHWLLPLTLANFTAHKS